MRPLRVAARCRRIANASCTCSSMMASSFRATSAAVSAPSASMFSTTTGRLFAAASSGGSDAATAASQRAPVSVSVNALLEQRKGSDEGATKMLHYASLPASSLVSSALEKMCKDSISMILVTKDDDPQTVVGYFSEKAFKNGVKHAAFTPESVTVGELARRDVFTVALDTPVVGAIHDLIHAGARHAVLLKAGAAGSGEGVVRVDGVAAADIAAVVSVRDLVGHAVSTHSKAQQLAEQAAEAVRLAKETETAAPDGAAATAEAWEALCEREAALDTLAYGSVVKDAEDALETLARLGQRTAYVNCLDTAKIDAATAANMMAQEGVAALLVVSEAGAVKGVFTTRDFIWKVAAPGTADDGGTGGARDATQTKVTDVMTTAVRAGRTHWSVEKCAKTMLRNSIRHLPVHSQTGDDFMGLVSLADMTRFVVKARFAAQGGEGDGTDAKLRQSAVEYFESLAEFGAGRA